VLACGDAELLALSRARPRLAALHGPPEPTAVSALVDKAQLAVNAAGAGLRVPGEAADGWPLVVKARVHHEPGRASSRWEVRVVHDAAELREAQARASAAGVDVVVQEHVAGRLIALSLVLDRAGAVVGRSQQVAERIWPVQAGVSARAVTVPVDEELAGRCADLLRAACWTGLAQLQLLDSGDGRPCLIDVNPRCTARCACGGRRSALARPRCPRAARRRRGPLPGRPPRRALPVAARRPARGAGGRPWAAASAAASGIGAVGAVRDLRDPGPAVASALALAQRAGRRRRRC
jgi:hypothetical protein